MSLAASGGVNFLHFRSMTWSSREHCLLQINLLLLLMMMMMMMLLLLLLLRQIRQLRSDSAATPCKPVTTQAEHKHRAAAAASFSSSRCGFNVLFRYRSLLIRYARALSERTSSC